MPTAPAPAPAPAPAQWTPHTPPPDAAAPTNNLFDPNTWSALHRAFLKHGPVVIERVPSKAEVSAHLNGLAARSTRPLFYHFSFSKRDLCVAVTHRHESVPAAVTRSFFSSPSSTPSSSNSTDQSSNNQHAPHIAAVVVNLFTTTQDYTFRCSTPFADGWENGLFNFPSGRAACDAGGGVSPGTGFNGSFVDLVKLTAGLLSPLQRSLLEGDAAVSPAYLHVLRVDKVSLPSPTPAASTTPSPTSTSTSTSTSTAALTGPPIELVFTVEVARRYKLGRESDVVPLRSTDISHWEHRNDFSRERATRAQITLWAMLDVVHPAERHDVARLRRIQATIDAEVVAVNVDAYVGDARLPVVVMGVNRVALLRVRNSQYQDGRARFAVAVGAVHDRGLLKPPPRIDPDEQQDLKQPPHGPSSTTKTAEGGKKGDSVTPTSASPKPVDPPRPPVVNTMPGFQAALEEPPALRETRVSYLALFKMLGNDLVIACLGLLYLLRLRDADAQLDDVVGVSLTLMGVLLVVSKLPPLSRLTRVRSVIREMTAPELLHDAGSSVRARLAAATSAAGRKYFNGKGLSFTDVSFTGFTDFPHTFRASDLLKAGYVTTFARDGREVLVDSDGRAFRLDSMYAGRASFAKVAHAQQKEQVPSAPNTLADRQLETQILPISTVAGIWSSDVMVGRTTTEQV